MGMAQHAGGKRNRFFVAAGDEVGDHVADPADPESLRGGVNLAHHADRAARALEPLAQALHQSVHVQPAGLARAAADLDQVAVVGAVLMGARIAADLVRQRVIVVVPVETRPDGRAVPGTISDVFHRKTVDFALGGEAADGAQSLAHGARRGKAVFHGGLDVQDALAVVEREQIERRLGMSGLPYLHQPVAFGEFVLVRYHFVAHQLHLLTFQIVEAHAARHRTQLRPQQHDTAIPLRSLLDQQFHDFPCRVDSIFQTALIRTSLTSSVTNCPRPRCLASYRTESARPTRLSMLSMSCICAMPMLTLFSMRLRILLATRLAIDMSEYRTMANSSPPMRQGWSTCSRTEARIALAMRFRYSSPYWCPWVSLMALKKSTSSSMRQSGSPWCLQRRKAARRRVS